MLKKLKSSQIKPPTHMDILLHLEKNVGQSEVTFVGIVLQYNIVSVGITPEMALEKTVRLATTHFKRCRERGIDAYKMAALYYSAAFVLGKPLPKIYDKVHTKMSMELIRFLGYPIVDVRSICDLQE
ncbi:MAG: hypothetical protein PVH77_01525 [Phycisphaerales bacterium]|jgi:hypothetical protein